MKTHDIKEYVVYFHTKISFLGRSFFIKNKDR